MNPCKDITLLYAFQAYLLNHLSTPPYLVSRERFELPKPLGNRFTVCCASPSAPSAHINGGESRNRTYISGSSDQHSDQLSHFSMWYPREESNLQAHYERQILNMVRLPISPLGYIGIVSNRGHSCNRHPYKKPNTLIKSTFS